MERLVKYIKDTRVELTHVAWPTRTQALIYTALVIVISALVAVFVGMFDSLFSQALNWFIR